MPVSDQCAKRIEAKFYPAQKLFFLVKDSSALSILRMTKRTTTPPMTKKTTTDCTERGVQAQPIFSTRRCSIPCFCRLSAATPSMANLKKTLVHGKIEKIVKTSLHPRLHPPRHVLGGIFSGHLNNISDAPLYRESTLVRVRRTLVRVRRILVRVRYPDSLAQKRARSPDVDSVYDAA